MPGLNPETPKTVFLALEERAAWKEKIKADLLNRLNTLTGENSSVTLQDGTVIENVHDHFAQAVADTVGEHLQKAIEDLISVLYSDIATNAIVITTCGAGPGTGTVQ